MGKKGQMAVKLDISKAYDLVEWNFLEGIMSNLGFAGQWINLIMACLKSVSYAILFNGEPHGLITPSRGIRQGDPLSPYLFLLCVEGLSCLLRKAELDNLFHGISVCRGGPRITHLLFVEDSLIFCEASVLECERLGTLLDLYEDASRQQVNRQKITLFFSKNTPSPIRIEVKQFWGVSSSSQFAKYLGLLASIGRNKGQTFKRVKDRLIRRLEGWNERFLSKAGREVLIKAVVQAISAYSMSVFMLPRGWCDEINALVAKYWWGLQGSSWKIHWCQWSSLCQPKEAGGLGFQDLMAFNKALLAKQGWRLLSNTHSLFFRTFKSKYFPKSSFLLAQLGSNPSFVWRSFLAARELLTERVRWKIGSGSMVEVWNDRWTPYPLSRGWFVRSPVCCRAH